MVMKFGNIEIMKRAVETEADVAIVPQRTMVHEVAQQSSVAVRFAEPRPRRPAAAIHRKSKALSLASRRFTEILKEPSEPTVPLSHLQL